MPNQLLTATSPYLLQHAHNPVNWYPWGEQALQRASAEDKPIFLSIGYSACHWCHVMAHESFEDPEIAAIMNSHFINIKVDREERPDLDSIYMNAVVALTGQGGWPMSVFLTPALIPFFGGTYFPPQPRHGLPAFKDVLQSIASLWDTDRGQLLQAGEELAKALSRRAALDIQPGSVTQNLLDAAASRMINSYNWDYGGWGNAPKFPQPMALDFLLRRYSSGDDDALNPVIHAIHAMTQGGMYDVVGGGFARYATDNHWRVPHFEKMLYDNAQLAQVVLNAFQITVEPAFKRVVEQTLDFVAREMRSPEGGFYSSLDADSEGVEGKFYVWTLDEIRNAFSGEDKLFEMVYGITSSGNWEGRIILQREVSDADLAHRFGLTTVEVQQQLAQRHRQLLEVRNQRVRPGTDDKVLTFWNGLMCSAFANAARTLENETYLKIAQANANFLLDNLIIDGNLRRTWRAGQVGNEVFLEDYAALILALLDLYQVDFDNRWYHTAYCLTGQMIESFRDPTGGFFDTPGTGETLLVRPKDLQDNATPSGNALAAEALLKMAAFSGNEEWHVTAETALTLVAGLLADYPTAFGRWLSAAAFNLYPTRQVALVGDISGPGARQFLHEINTKYRPYTVVAASPPPAPEGSPELLSRRNQIDNRTTVYVCEGFVCRQPLTTLHDLKTQLIETIN